MKTEIAVIADIHFGERAESPQVRSEIADVLLLRTVNRLNRMIKPDVTLILGDVVNEGNSPCAENHCRRARDIIDRIESPTIVIPGNHDCDTDRFYTFFDRPNEVTDINGVRFITFLDPERPEYNAERTVGDLARMAAARADFAGHIVMLQHVPLFPPGRSECPFNYLNADQVIATMQRYGITLAVSGHYHAGVDLIRTEQGSFIAAPALCESPFDFLQITLDGNEITAKRHALQMPKSLNLVDLHIHSPFAYCNQNMDIPRALALADDFGLAGFAFTEHSGHLYFNRDTYWKGDFLSEGINAADEADRRVDGYFQALRRAGCPQDRIAMEVDCDFRGNPVIRPEDRAGTAFIIGAVHALKELRTERPDLKRAQDQFLAVQQRFLRSGIKVLAHPLRVFVDSGQQTPPALFEPLVRMLRENNVAAEINFNTKQPLPEFISLCIKAGVKLTFGSDAHNLCAIGELAPHLDLLRSCGFDGSLDDIMLPVPFRV